MNLMLKANGLRSQHTGEQLHPLLALLLTLPQGVIGRVIGEKKELSLGHSSSLWERIGCLSRASILFCPSMHALRFVESGTLLRPVVDQP